MKSVITVSASRRIAAVIVRTSGSGGYARERADDVNIAVPRGGVGYTYQFLLANGT